MIIPRIKPKYERYPKRLRKTVIFASNGNLLIWEGTFYDLILAHVKNAKVGTPAKASIEYDPQRTELSENELTRVCNPEDIEDYWDDKKFRWWLLCQALKRKIEGMETDYYRTSWFPKMSNESDTSNRENGLVQTQESRFRVGDLNKMFHRAVWMDNNQEKMMFQGRDSQKILTGTKCEKHGKLFLKLELEKLKPENQWRFPYDKQVN